MAVDTMLVCPVSRDGTARRGAAQAPGSATVVHGRCCDNLSVVGAVPIVAF